MALLVHHWKEVIEIWLEAVDDADDDALPAIRSLNLTFFVRVVTPFLPRVERMVISSNTPGSSGRRLLDIAETIRVQQRQERGRYMRLIIHLHP